MQFKIYDILSKLLPGMLLLTVFFLHYYLTNDDIIAIEAKFTIYKDVSGILTTLFLLFSFFMGYVISSMGSWIEPWLYKSWGGLPSQILFKDKSKRIRLFNKEQVFSVIAKETGEKTLMDSTIQDLNKEQFRSLFSTAKNKANLTAKDRVRERIEEFNNTFIFSRNTLVALLICLIILVVLAAQHLVKWWLIGVIVALILTFWWRCRDRALYYAREILTAAYQAIEADTETEN